MKLYVSGPIKGLPLDEAQRRFKAGADLLVAHGYEALNPFDVDPACNCPDGKPLTDSSPHYDCYLRGDIAAMMLCDGVALLDGWEASRGARIEMSTAVLNGMPAWPIREWVGRQSAFDLVAHLERQRTWSAATFGPSSRAKGVVDHIRKELIEIEADPTDVTEWIDVVILALDGAWRSGASPQQIVDALAAKQSRNEARQWPDWRTASEDQAIEHVREEAAS